MTKQWYNHSNWTGKSPRTLQEAFGPYESLYIQEDTKVDNTGWKIYATILFVSVLATIYLI